MLELVLWQSRDLSVSEVTEGVHCGEVFSCSEACGTEGVVGVFGAEDVEVSGAFVVLGDEEVAVGVDGGLDLGDAAIVEH